MPEQPPRPHPPAGVKMPPRPPAGVKMPPRPPAGVKVPPGIKAPPRPAGGAIPPAAVPVPPQVPAFENYPPVPEANSFPDYREREDSYPRSERAGYERENDVDDEEDYAEDEENPYQHNMASDLGLPPVFVSTKVLLFLFFLCLSLGAGGGYLFCMTSNSGSGEIKGVVSNAEIPRGRPRCGIAQKGQGCVLYVMNAQRREMEGRDFFTMASEILNVPKFQIETANIRYATVRIPPGYIALLNIPPMQ